MRMDSPESPTDYCKRQLNESLRFEELRHIAFSVDESDPEYFAASGIHYDSRKEQLVDFVAEAIVTGHVNLPYAALKICRRPCIWFTMLTGQSSQFPQRESLHKFFSTNDEGWFGPLQDEEVGSSLYIYRYNFFDYVTQALDSTADAGDNPDVSDDDSDNCSGSDTLVRVQRPWCVIFEIFPRYAVLSWNGSNHRTTDTESAPEHQFPFWIFIKKLLDEMPAWLPGLVLIDPYNLFLSHLWDKYRNHPEYSWEDVGARSEQDGVAMSARAGGGLRNVIGIGSNRTLKGIAALAERLAYAALEKVNLATDNNVQTAREAVLEQIIKHGAIKSFEFALVGQLSQILIFQAHIYFGAREKGQDSLIHFRSYQKHGGASQTSKFLARELGVL
jgi:hypothetical protein